MKITKEKALKLLDEKISQFQKILSETTLNNRYGQDYELVYYGTESILKELFSADEQKNFRSAVTSICSEHTLEDYKEHLNSCISQLKVYREKIDNFWENGESINNKEKISKLVVNKLTNIELENELIKYLTNKVNKEEVNINDLSLNGLFKYFNITNENDKKRLKKILENLVYDKLIKSKSGINLYIPVELQKHPNIIALNLVNPYHILYSYIAGFVTILIIVGLIPVLNIFLINIFKSMNSSINIIVTGAIFGFFLPMFLGLVYYKIYQRLILTKSNINRGALITTIASIFSVLLCYGLLINILIESVSAIGIISSIGVGCAIATILWKYVFKSKKNEKIHNEKLTIEGNRNGHS